MTVNVHSCADQQGSEESDHFIVDIEEECVVELTGGRGNNVYTIYPTAGSSIVITDFSLNHDIIDLTLMRNIRSFKSVNMTRGSVRMHLPNRQTIILLNRDPAEMTPDHFRFRKAKRERDVIMSVGQITFILVIVVIGFFAAHRVKGVLSEKPIVAWFTWEKRDEKVENEFTGMYTSLRLHRVAPLNVKGLLEQLESRDETPVFALHAKVPMLTLPSSKDVMHGVAVTDTRVTSPDVGWTQSHADADMFSMDQLDAMMSFASSDDTNSSDISDALSISSSENNELLVTADNIRKMNNEYYCNHSMYSSSCSDSNIEDDCDVLGSISSESDVDEDCEW